MKIETSPVLRGSVHSPKRMRVVPIVEERFGFAEAQVVSFSDLFAGKLVAALDRQHPRDLFDVMLLLNEEGISDELFRTFLVYAVSSPRPLDELFDPNLHDLAPAFDREFAGMADRTVLLEELEHARTALLSQLRSHIDDRTRRFLLGVHDVQPDFSLLGLPQAEYLPAIRWKLLNLERLAKDNPKKHSQLRVALEAALNLSG